MENNFLSDFSLHDLRVPSLSSQRKERNTHYRAHIASICYPEIIRDLEKTSLYDMPIIEPNIIIPDVISTTPFDRIRAKNANADSLVMFYINDDRFATKLTHPWTYTAALKQFTGVIGPDLSQYTDMDYATRLANNYWNKAMTAYWQHEGVNMYSNVTWSLPDSYEYSVAGYPHHSVIAINSIGILSSNYSRSLWLAGYNYMIEHLEPICILRYGPKIYGENEDISIYLENEQIKLLRNGR